MHGIRVLYSALLSSVLFYFTEIHIIIFVLLSVFCLFYLPVCGEINVFIIIIIIIIVITRRWSKKLKKL